MKRTSNFPYKNYVFDCDGVILDSNHIKTDAMKILVEPYGKQVTEEYINFHRQNAGLPRLKKFIHLFENILNIKDSSSYKVDLEKLMENFQKITIEKLKSSNEIIGVRKYIEKLPIESKKFIVSGAPQEDLEIILNYKNLTPFFNEICGSPKTKKENFNFLKSKYDLSNSIFFGDSMIDYNMAMEFNMDFVFIYGKSDFDNWQDFFISNKNAHSTSVKISKDFTSN